MNNKFISKAIVVSSVIFIMFFVLGFKTSNDNVPKTVYPILGQPSKLTEKQKAAMDAWKNNLVELTKKNKAHLFINGYTKDKVVALTFDDGPDPVTTPKILSILQKNNVHASFFLIGNQIPQYANVVKEAYKEGNLVLNHSYTHPALTKLSEQQINKELKLTEDQIYKLIGKRPAIIRPPYGDINQNTLNILTKNNYTTVLWSTDTLDWLEKQKNTIVNNVVWNVRPGEIVLMHSNANREATIEALPEIILKLKALGYTFVTLDQLLKVNPYK